MAAAGGGGSPAHRAVPRSSHSSSKPVISDIVLSGPAGSAARARAIRLLPGRLLGRLLAAIRRPRLAGIPLQGKGLALGAAAGRALLAGCPQIASATAMTSRGVFQHCDRQRIAASGAMGSAVGTVGQRIIGAERLAHDTSLRCFPRLTS